jgi:redox-sensing transcriptional repressor
MASGNFHKASGFGLRRMVGRKKVPHIVVQRLPLYLRALSTLEEGAQITSQELGEMLGISSAQIRKDLSYFGGFGKQGTGYQVGYLRQKLREILHVDREWSMVLVGVGDLGHAIARYGGFKREGFHVVAALDNDPTRIGKRVGALEIMDVGLLPEVVNRMGLRVGIIAVPASEAQEVATTMVTSGIKAILNYTPVALTVPEGVQVYQIDPLVGLQSMTHYLEG